MHEALAKRFCPPLRLHHFVSKLSFLSHTHLPVLKAFVSPCPRPFNWVRGPDFWIGVYVQDALSILQPIRQDWMQFPLMIGWRRTHSVTVMVLQG